MTYQRVTTPGRVTGPLYSVRVRPRVLRPFWETFTEAGHCVWRKAAKMVRKQQIVSLEKLIKKLDLFHLRTTRDRGTLRDRINLEVDLLHERAVG